MSVVGTCVPKGGTKGPAPFGGHFGHLWGQDSYSATQLPYPRGGSCAEAPRSASMVVDDCGINRAIMSRYLGMMGCTTREVDNGKAAVAMDASTPVQDAPKGLRKGSKRRPPLHSFSFETTT